MKEQIQALTAVYHECAHAAGLTVLGYGGTHDALGPDECSDSVSGRVVVEFDTAGFGKTARPLARVTIEAEELTASPVHLAQIVRERVSVAKRELIEQMKAAIARLEALP